MQADKCIKVWFKARIENKMVLVIDWKESNKYDYVSSPRCLQDSNAVWFWARNGTKRKLVVNWKESKEYDYVGIPNFKLVNKEWLLWFTATRSNKQILIVDWKESKGYDRVDAPIFSPDWKEVMYAAYNKDEKIFVCKDKEYSLSGWINYMPNSEKIWFISARGDKKTLVINCNEGAKYDDIEEVSFSKDESRYVYKALKGKKWVVVVDGKESKEYLDIFGLILYPESKRYGYRAHSRLRAEKSDGFTTYKDEGWIVVIDGIESKEYISTGNPIFSSDGKRVVFWAEMRIKNPNGGSLLKAVMIVDGVAGSMYDYVVDIEFSPDSKNMFIEQGMEKKVL